MSTNGNNDHQANGATKFQPRMLINGEVSRIRIRTTFQTK